MAKTRFLVGVLLPDVPDAGDACMGRLTHLVQGRPGVQVVHAVDGQGELCVHFDPGQVSLDEVRRLVTAAGARVSEQYGHVTLPVHSWPSEDAGRRLEDILRRVDGVVGASASLPAQRVRVEFERAVVDPARLARVVAEAGFAPAAPGARAEVPPTEPRQRAASWLANPELRRSLAAGAVLLVGWLGERAVAWPPQVAVAIYVAAYALGAWDLVRHTVRAWTHGAFSFDIDLLMLVAAVGAAGLGQWAEGAFLLTLFALAHALEHLATDRARGAIRALAELAPSRARVRRNGEDLEVPVESVGVDETVLVRPGDRVPVDGVVLAGRSAVNQASVTGESIPVEKGDGDTVFAGTVNGEGALEVRATNIVGDRTLDRVVKLVEEAQTAKAPTQQFTDRFERVFVPVVLVAAPAVMVGLPLVGAATWSDAIYKGLSLLVAASPCALALGTPSAVLAGIAQAARRGVLIKGGAHLEQLGGLKVIAFDKTGTLTMGRPEVTDVVPQDADASDEVLRVAAAVERLSQHPLARAIVRAAEQKGLDIPIADQFQSVTGKGVRASVDGDAVEIGSARMWEASGTSIPMAIDVASRQLQNAGRTVMIVKHGPRWLGVVGLADQPRAEARDVLARLRSLGLGPLVMLTGDNWGVADAVAKELGVDETRAELLPEGKVDAIRALAAEVGPIAMVGDGVNDAPALAQAAVGIAMGGAGTAVALETADVALMGDDLTTLPLAIGLARAASRIIRQNLVLSLAVIAVLVAATLIGWAGIGAAVVLHEGSTMIVVLNSLRLLAYAPQQP